MEHTLATKRKLSKMRKGANNPFYGHKHTDATKLKMATHTRLMNAKRQYTRRPANIKVPYLLGRDMGYLCGLIDGEGSIGFKRKTPFVAVYNTSVPVMKWLKEHIGGNYGAIDYRGRVPCYAWQIQAVNDVMKLLKSVSIGLIIKKNNALNVLKILEEKYGEHHKNRMV